MTEERLSIIENKVSKIDYKVDNLISRVDNMGTNISYIAERLSRPAILPILLVITVSLVPIVLFFL